MLLRGIVFLMKYRPSGTIQLLCLLCILWLCFVWKYPGKQTGRIDFHLLPGINAVPKAYSLNR